MAAERYRVFTNNAFRATVSESLVQQAEAEGLCLPNPTVQYCFIAGMVRSGSREALHDHFNQKEWLLYDDEWVREELRHLASLGYEDDVAIMVAKLFMRDSPHTL